MYSGLIKYYMDQISPCTLHPLYGICSIILHPLSTTVYGIKSYFQGIGPIKYESRNMRYVNATTGFGHYDIPLKVGKPLPIFHSVYPANVYIFLRPLFLVRSNTYSQCSVTQPCRSNAGHAWLIDVSNGLKQWTSIYDIYRNPQITLVFTDSSDAIRHANIVSTDLSLAASTASLSAHYYSIPLCLSTQTPHAYIWGVDF